MNYIAKKIALQEKNILNHADLYLDYNNRIAFHKNRKINLTVKEFDILFFLASYPGQVFTHRQIYETVWGKEYFCDEGNVTAHIGHIRKKIELDPRNPVFIQTVRGIGYKFDSLSYRALSERHFYLLKERGEFLNSVSLYHCGTGCVRSVKDCPP